MAGWSIRRKLMLLVTIPLVALLVGGGVLVFQFVAEYRQARTAKTYAEAVLPALVAGDALAREFGAQEFATDPARLRQVRTSTDVQIGELQEELAELRRGDPQETQLPNVAERVQLALDRVPNARRVVDRLVGSGQITRPESAGQVATASRSSIQGIQELVALLTDELSSQAPDQETADGAVVVGAMNQVAQNAGTERALLADVLTTRTMSAERLGQLNTSASQQALSLESADLAANPEQKRALQAVVSDEDQMADWRAEAETLLGDGQADVANAGDWNKFSTDRLAAIIGIVNTSAQDTQESARDAEASALGRSGAVTGAVVLTLLLVTALLAFIARSVTLPLRRLRSGAVDVASVQLPAAVARIEQDGTAADVSLPPVLPADTYAGPETVEVARAVDDLGAEAVRLATAQVRLRRALDEAFVSMSRRSQAMVEKQLGIIDQLESQEQDPDQLRNLFRLDHLAARMRRYNDNLLVLAGSAVRTRATAPVKVAELFRAATSEMEQYERVRLQPVSGASIAGTVAGELVHLLAELLDNAAMYSPPSSAIVLSAAFTADGGLQIEVLDAGVGISPGELDRLNSRLAQPETIDTQVPSRMGLFVVARLARRGGFSVMLQGRPDASGTIAMVRVPPTLVIGAPGSIGDQPAVAALAGSRGPATGSFGPPSAELPRIAPPQTPARPSFEPVARAEPQTGSTPAAAAAAAAAANVRSMVDEEESGSPLPRRRKPPRTSAAPGLDPVQIAAAANVTPPVGLFTPATPTDEPADRPVPPDTSPNGLPAVATDAGLPRRPVGGSAATGPSGIGLGAAMGSSLGSSFGTPVGGGFGLPDTDSPAAPAAGPSGLAAAFSSGRGEPSPYATTDPVTGLPPDVPTRTVEATGEVSASALPDTSALFGGLPRREPQQSGPDTGSLLYAGLGGEPLTAFGGAWDKPADNPSIPEVGSGAAPAAWDGELPTELAARAAAERAYRPADPNLPMIGEYVPSDVEDSSPIFEEMSAWFSADPATGGVPAVNGEAAVAAADGTVIDLRDRPDAQPSRWAALGDQRWLATNARASAAPDTAGTTETGLPMRRPGANLLPSATAAAPGSTRGGTVPPPLPAAPSAPRGNEEADLIRGRLGSYQRGLATARRNRPEGAAAGTFDPVGASLFAANREPGDDAGDDPGTQGGDQ